ncbi:MAG: DUF6283 family protein [Moraxella sp.]|nr:DUF6283 family protein [Moraxella sp.]
MKFELKRPCKDCPFRNDKPHQQGWLGEKRAMEIYENLLDGGCFPCHKTHDYLKDDGNGFTHQEGHQFCAGALIMLENENKTAHNQALRVAMRLRLYDPDGLDMSSPVFNNGDEFIDWHGSSK